MSPSPILKVLSTFRKRRIRALLMGGQACILYGGAEFSRDIDFAVAVDARNLDRLRRALADLRARPLFFPLLSAAVLRRGHGEKEFEGYVFAFDEPDSWYFMPDGEPDEREFWAFGQSVRVTSPTKEYRPRLACALSREEVEEMRDALTIALEGR